MSTSPTKLFYTASEKSRAAKTESTLRRAAVKCTKAEEVVRFLGDLLKEGISVPSDEEFLLSKEGQMKAHELGTQSKDDLRKILVKSKIRDARKEASR